MNLYLLSQSQNTGYDTYDSCVVAAPSKREAIKLHPTSMQFPDHDWWGSAGRSWTDKPEQVTCELIGKAASHIKQGVIIASFNAG